MSDIYLSPVLTAWGTALSWLSPARARWPSAGSPYSSSASAPSSLLLAALFAAPGHRPNSGDPALALAPDQASVHQTSVLADRGAHLALHLLLVRGPTEMSHPALCACLD